MNFSLLRFVVSAFWLPILVALRSRMVEPKEVRQKRKREMRIESAKADLHNVLARCGQPGLADEFFRLHEKLLLAFSDCGPEDHARRKQVTEKCKQELEAFNTIYTLIRILASAEVEKLLWAIASS